MKLHAAIALVSTLGTASAVDLVRARHRNLRNLEEDFFMDEGVGKESSMSVASMEGGTGTGGSSAKASKKSQKSTKSGKSSKVEEDCAIVPKVDSDDPDVWHGDPCFRASTIVPKCKAGTVEQISGTTWSRMLGVSNWPMPDEFPTPEHKKFWGSENCSTSNHPGTRQPYPLANTCIVGEWSGDMEGLYGGGHFSPRGFFASDIAFPEFTPRGPQPGNPGIMLQRGSNWVYTDICNKRRGIDKREWINFDTVQTGTSVSLPVPDMPIFDPNDNSTSIDEFWERFFEYMKAINAGPGSSNYNLNTENSQGCDGFHISFILWNTVGYWNEQTETPGCNIGSCSWAGYICELEEDTVIIQGSR